MNDFPTPEVPFNPITAPVDAPITPVEIIAGPLGLVLFLPLIPLVRLGARFAPRASLLTAAFVWLWATLGPQGAVIVTFSTSFSGSYIMLLGLLRRRGWIGKRTMIAAVWIGLHLIMFPLWWWADWDWYGWGDCRFQVLHPIGFAYVLLRLIAWGVDWAHQPPTRLRIGDTVAWLLYPAGFRNGPFLLREKFLERWDAWNPRGPVPWRQVLWHLMWALVGMAGLTACAMMVPPVMTAGQDFFAHPELYTTGQLLAVFYFVPMAVYFFLWGYNEFALAAGLWMGIPLDTNFVKVPLSTSPRDFWRRWNVNVGAWVRKYVYIPLGGNQRPGVLMYSASFGYTGLWHGAAWSYVAWPAIQVVALTVQRWWDRYREWRGWGDQRPSRPWLACCWLLTMHLQTLTVFVFADFHCLGLRLLGELWSRATGG